MTPTGIRKKILVFGLAIGAAGAFLGGAYIFRLRGNEGNAAQSGDGPIAERYADVPVRVAVVESRLIPVEAELFGFLEPNEALTLSAQIGGEIDEQWVDVSSEVTRDQPLLKIDDETRKFEVEQAQATHKRALNEFELTKTNWERVQSLPTEGSTALEHEEAHRKFLSAEATLNEARAAAEFAQLMLERTVERSPIDGLVSRLYRRKGEFAQPGMPLLDVIEIERLKLLAEVADSEVVWIRPGDQVDLATDVFPGDVFHGQVTKVYPRALPTSRRFQIEVEIDNSDRQLRPGLFVRGIIQKPASGSEPATLVIPREAVIEQFGAHWAFRTVDQQGKAVAQRVEVEVQPIPAQPRWWRVVSGLEEGDRVITKGARHLRDGTLIRIQQPAEP